MRRAVLAVAAAAGVGGAVVGWRGVGAVRLRGTAGGGGSSAHEPGHSGG